MSELVIRNRQRTRALNIPLLRRITQHLIENEFGALDFELGVHLVGSTEMARLNERFLGHEGSTDVITFDHGSSMKRLHGEIFISIGDAVKQAREFRTSWQSEFIRYVIHALLHLRGHDDLHPAKRRVMKREENRLVKRIASQFALEQLGRTRTAKPNTRKFR